MSREDVAWVEPQQSGSGDAAVPQIFSIAPAYGLVPDFDTLATLFQDEGNERMAALVQEKAAAIQDLLNVHHPRTLFVMPGGADLPFCAALNGAPNQRIRQFVERGGAYLGICAGAYYACRKIAFHAGTEGAICGPRELGFLDALATTGPAC